ncbi:hypothetical protein WCE02_14545 [Pseudomonas juntendi]
MAWAACAVIGMQFISLVGRMVMHDESADASWFNTAFYLLAAVLVCRAKGNVAKILQVDWWLAVDAPPGANGSTNGQAFLNSAVIKQADILNLVITGGRTHLRPDQHQRSGRAAGVRREHHHP